MSSAAVWMLRPLVFCTDVWRALHRNPENSHCSKSIFESSPSLKTWGLAVSLTAVLQITAEREDALQVLDVEYIEIKRPNKVLTVEGIWKRLQLSRPNTRYLSPGTPRDR